MIKIKTGGGGQAWGQKLLRTLILLQDRIYLFSVGAIIFLKCLSDKSMLQEQYPGSMLLRAMDLLLVLFYFVLAVKIIFFTEYSTRERVFMLCAAVVAGIAYLGSGDLTVPRAFLIVAGGKNVDYHRIFRYALYALSLAAALIFLLALAGFLTNREVSNRQDEQIIRYSLGFNHPNVLSGILLVICMLWFAIDYNSLRWWHYAAGVGLLAAVYFIADSRSGEIGLIILMMLTAAGKRFDIYSRSKPWSKYLWALIPLLALASLALAMSYSYDQVILRSINKLLTGRIENWSAYYRGFGFSWFGQKIYFVRYYYGNVIPSSEPGFDNAYAILGVRYGMVPLILFCVGHALVMLQPGRRHIQAELVVCVLTAAIYSFAESQMVDICFNPALLALPMLFPRNRSVPKDTFSRSMLDAWRRLRQKGYGRSPSTGSGNSLPKSRS